MIEKNVVIFVRGEQIYDGSDPDATELISEGTMSIDDGGAVTLTYQETELTGMEGTTTRFTIQGDSVVLTRTGSVNSQMVFQKGVRHSSLYETPYGALTVDVSTLRLAHRLGERGGVLEADYTVAVEHQLVSRNQFKIRIRESMR